MACRPSQNSLCLSGSLDSSYLRHPCSVAAAKSEEGGHLGPGTGLLVVVEGNIGSGKSTVLHALARMHAASGGVMVRQEPVDAPEWAALLALASSSPRRWAFTLQVAVFVQMALRSRTCDVETERGRVWLEVAERDVHSALAFVRVGVEVGTLSDVEASTIKKLILLHEQGGGRRPDVLVYLASPAEACLKRVRSRQRVGEESVSLEYLSALERAMLDQIHASRSGGMPVAVVDVGAKSVEAVALELYAICCRHKPV